MHWYNYYMWRERSNVRGLSFLHPLSEELVKVQNIIPVGEQLDMICTNGFKESWRLIFSLIYQPGILAAHRPAAGIDYNMFAGFAPAQAFQNPGSESRKPEKQSLVYGAPGKEGGIIGVDVCNGDTCRSYQHVSNCYCVALSIGNLKYPAVWH